MTGSGATDRGGGGAERRVDAVFRGRVQGVGFRYTVERLAGAWPVRGYVANLPDGSVRLVVEGREEELQLLLRDLLASRLGTYISGHQETWSDSCHDFTAFRIRYDA